MHATIPKGNPRYDQLLSGTEAVKLPLFYTCKDISMVRNEIFLHFLELLESRKG